jgi:hypothetical protein
MSDDRFDEIMNEENQKTQEPENETDIAEEQTPEKSREEVVEDPENEDTPEGPSLDERLAELEKANKGLLQTVTAEREKRQRFEGAYNQLNNIVTETIAKRERKPEPEPKREPRKIPVSYDEDGNPFIEEDALAELVEERTKPLGTSLEDEKAYRELQHRQAQKNQAIDHQIRSVVMEEEGYDVAYNDLKKAIEFTVVELAEYMRENGIQARHDMGTGAMIDVASGTRVEKAFNERFPQIELDQVIRAFESRADLRRALKRFKDSAKPKIEKTGIDSNLKKIANKANNLSNVRNQKSPAPGDTLEDLAEKYSGSIEEMSDSEYDAFKRKLRELSK